MQKFKKYLRLCYVCVCFRQCFVCFVGYSEAIYYLWDSEQGRDAMTMICLRGKQTKNEKIWNFLILFLSGFFDAFGLVLFNISLHLIKYCDQIENYNSESFLTRYK